MPNAGRPIASKSPEPLKPPWPTPARAPVGVEHRRLRRATPRERRRLDEPPKPIVTAAEDLRTGARCGSVTDAPVAAGNAEWGAVSAAHRAPPASAVAGRGRKNDGGGVGERGGFEDGRRPPSANRWSASWWWSSRRRRRRQAAVDTLAGIVWSARLPSRAPEPEQRHCRGGRPRTPARPFERGQEPTRALTAAGRVGSAVQSARAGGG